MQGMQLSGLACRVTSRQSWKEDCMTEMHLLCIYVRGFQLDNTGTQYLPKLFQILKIDVVNGRNGVIPCKGQLNSE